MKGFTDRLFRERYFREEIDKEGNKKEKIQDYFQTIKPGEKKLLPFTQTPSANLYDGNCGLIGVTGEFYRIMTQSGVKPIYTASDAIETLKGALKEKYKMADDDIERFVNLFEDIFFDNNALNVVDTSFFVFAPLKYSVGTSAESKKQHPGKENYRSGQLKLLIIMHQWQKIVARYSVRNPRTCSMKWCGIACKAQIHLAAEMMLINTLSYPL